MKQAIYTSKAPHPIGAYSPAVKVGDWVFVSGQGPEDSITHEIKGKTIEEQTQFTVENLLAVLAEAGAKPEDVVQVQVYLRDLNDFSRFNEVYAKYFPDPKPARTTVGCNLINGIMIEINAIALVGRNMRV
jgi:2-iminobutanoate/2-iminopropanoate deaminase